MAAIDKIYGDTAQYDELYGWVEENKPELLKFFYPRDGYILTSSRPITNFPEWADKWLMKNCPIRWVVSFIKDQYGIVENTQRSRKHKGTVRHRPNL